MVMWPELPALSRRLHEARPTKAGSPAISARFADLLAQETRGFSPRVIKVTGTNGKGSVCSMLEACLLKDGLRVGLFTSPHLISPAERFRVDGRDVEPNVLEAHALCVERTVREHAARHGEAATPSFFEVLVLLAVRIFRDARVDIAIFEAGVGGSNDATSLLDGDLAAITSVALDHQDRLGSTVEAIARDKVGIASFGSDLVLGPSLPMDALRTIATSAAAHGLTLHPAQVEPIRAQNGGLLPARVGIDLDEADGPIEFDLPLLGDHQLHNLAVVVSLAKLLHARGALRDLRSLRGIETARWAGRMDLRPPLRDGGPSVLFDVAHNEHGIAALRESLDRRIELKKRVVLYGASADKDYRACLPWVPLLGREVYVVGGFYRAEDAALIASLLPPPCVARVFDGVADGMRKLLDSRLEGTDLVVVTGSLYLTGEAMLALKQARSDLSPARDGTTDGVLGDG